MLEFLFVVKVLNHKDSDMPQRHDLLELAHAFGNPANELCIFAEGNVSCRGEPGTFWIKGSGQGMEHITSAGFVEVRSEPVLAMLDSPPSDEAEVRECLNRARSDPANRQVPSTEAFMHAFLLSQPETNFVGHAHPTSLLSLLFLEVAKDLAVQRWFPDEIVCCGPASCYVRYVAPGLPLAVEIRKAVASFINEWGKAPKTLWLQNHGLICVGSTPSEVHCAAMMSIKAAKAVLGALQTGKPLRPLTKEEVAQISAWPDEHYRQRLLFAASHVNPTGR